MPERSDFSAGEARRIALAAQALADPRPPGAPDARAFRRLARRLGVIQIDSVNVLARSHYLPPFARLGPYPREILDAEAWGRRKSLFEYWGHMASLMPMELQPLFRWRMERARSGQLWQGLARFGREQRDYIDAVLERIAREGPLTGGDFAEGKREAGWWNWSNGKRALEWLFWAGLITTRTRRGFERVYDLTERVIPRAVLVTPTPGEPDAQRALITIAAQAMGVATEGDLRDYFRLPVEGFKSRVAELVEAGELKPVTVRGWNRPAFFAAGARVPRRTRAATVLSPFDNLVWRRERTERLFGLRYRIEIYTPAHKREHGYYVLPFLVGDTIAARVDLKSDRASGVLRIQAAHLEPGAGETETVQALAHELAALAGWLGLGVVTVEKVGRFDGALQHALAALDYLGQARSPSGQSVSF